MKICALNVGALIQWNIPFLDCPVSFKFYGEITPWFNQKNKTEITLANEQFLFQNYELLSIPISTLETATKSSRAPCQNVISMHLNLPSYARINLSL